MAEIHIREKDRMDKTVNLVMHFIVPLTQNANGTNWNEVIQKALKPVASMDDNDTTENAAVASGSVLELAETMRYSSTNLTNAQRLAEIQAFYLVRKDEVFGELAATLDFFGKEF